MKIFKNSSKRIIPGYLFKEKKALFGLALFFLTGFLLRTLFLGNTFESADNAALADRIVHNRGYSWMVREYYGFMISFLVKLFAATVSFVGLNLTEFWWKLPVALVGSGQIILSFLFLKKWFGSTRLALLGAAIVAWLPVHVEQSRYLWGYEVLATFFLTLFLWHWLSFFQNPSSRSGFWASLSFGLYLLSHGYFFPAFPALFASLFFLPVRIREDERQDDWPRKSALRNLASNLHNLIRYRVWLYPLLFSALTAGAVNRALQKKVRAGIYAAYLSDIIANTGIFLFLFIVVALFVFFIKKQFLEPSFTWIFLLLALSYLAPLFLAAPPGVTVVRGYMTVGIYWLLVFALGVLFSAPGQKQPFSPAINKAFKHSKGEGKIDARSKFWPGNPAASGKRGSLKPTCFTLIISLSLALTLWGTIESVFFGDRLIDPSLARAGRGSPWFDPGTKAAGYLLTKYFPADNYPPSSFPILVLHRNIEPPNVSYYWRRKALTFYDYSLKQTYEAYLNYKEKTAVIIADPAQVSFVSSDGRFLPRVILYQKGQPRLWIFVRRDFAFVPIPEIRDEVKPLNKAFDLLFSWKVNFW